MNNGKVGLEQFRNLYKLQKTLRFELKPIGKTKDFVTRRNLIEVDEDRANKYKEVKKIIDRYHRLFIEEALDGFELKGLSDFNDLYNIRKRDDKQKKEFENIKKHLRFQISNRFKKHPNETIREQFKNLFKAELIKNDLKEFVEESEIYLLNAFDSFTTYFDGFHLNRANMYSKENQSTAIGFRLIEQNINFFFDNINIFRKIEQTDIVDKFDTIIQDLGDKIEINAIEESFEVNFFNKTLTQSGIDAYNTLIGGYTPESGGEKVQGINEYINSYNNNQAEKKDKIGFLKPLYKQILSESTSNSFILDVFENDNDVIKAIKEFYDSIINSIEKIKNLIEELSTYDTEKIYIKNDTSLTNISQKMFEDYSFIKRYLTDNLNVLRKNKESDENFEIRKSKLINAKDSFTITEINEAIKKAKVNDITIDAHVKKLGQKDKDEKGEAQMDLISKIHSNYKECELLLVDEYPTSKKLQTDNESIKKIKTLLDSIKDLQHFIMPLLGKGNEFDKDPLFYGQIQPLFLELKVINKLYDKVRNYVTKKPYSKDKFKLNFNTPTLLKGWDVNKEINNSCTILRKDGLYYLAILNKKFNKELKDVLNSNTNEEDCYEKMYYKYLPDASKMIPKCTTQLKEVKNHFQNNTNDYLITGEKFIEPLLLSKRIYDLNNMVYNSETRSFIQAKSEEAESNNDSLPKKFQYKYYQITNDFEGYKSALTDWIDFCKTFLNVYESSDGFNFNFEESKDYAKLDGFYSDVKKVSYNIKFEKVATKIIDKLVDDGKVYLFQLHNKDFSPNSKGTPNLHTIYWKLLFDEENINDVVYKLNGEAEMFFRKKSIEDGAKITHLKNKDIDNKNSLNPKPQSQFKYDIIKDKRFTEDKFQFHVPITINYKALELREKDINKNVLSFLEKNDDIHIIGIDRGERHLLYLSLINKKGEIIKQYSLNDITNEYKNIKHTTSYHGLLDKKEGNRDEARKNWTTIENIKELKEGYLSQVVHIISKLIVEYNAIVVLEDLNFGFKRGRFKVEKQVYQKFEKMLIDKLNYLIDKNKPQTEIGGALKALQLTTKFESFKDISKQSGFLFYVPAWNTSKMDPVTGFVNLFNTNYETVEKSKEFFKNFDGIRFNSEMNWFEFSFDYNKFHEKAKDTKTKWVVIGDNKERYTWDLKSKKQVACNVAENLAVLLGSKNIAYGNGENLIPAILEQNDARFFKELLFLLKTLLSLRHNNGKTGAEEEDYILSPVMDKNGNFFDSRKALNNQPNNADSNGAYNIARKGLLLLTELDYNGVDAFDEMKYKKDKDESKWVSNKQWLQFVQQFN